jgi:H+/Cl- antiporter ClcA
MKCEFSPLINMQVYKLHPVPNILRKLFSWPSYVSVQYKNMNFAPLDTLPYKNYITEGGYKMYLGLNLMQWLSTFVIAAVIGIMVAALDFLSRMFGYYKFSLMSKMVKHCEDDGMYSIKACYGQLIGATLAVNIICTMCSALIGAYESARVYSGSGLTLTASYLNGIFLPRALSIRTGFSMAIGIFFSILGGLAVGREAAMIYVAAILMTNMASGTFLGLRLSRMNFLWHFGAIDRDQKDLVTIGAAAGLAATFGTPFGAVLYVLEEGASFWRHFVTARATLAGFIAYFVASQITRLTLLVPTSEDHYGILESGVFFDLGFKLEDILYAIFMGMLGGLIGAAFNCLALTLKKFRTR